MSVDLAVPLRSAIVANSAITAKLTAYGGSFPVFTRRPLPADVPKLVIIVSPDIAQSNTDGLSDQRPVFTRDISIYGKNDSPQDYRDVEMLAYLIHDLFHRKRNAISVVGWGVSFITAVGPIVAPTDDDNFVGRLVTLNIQLGKLGAA